MTNSHEEQTENHILHRWEYANAAARTGATGFVSADIGKACRQTDTDVWYILTATAPTWQEIGAGGGDVTGPGSSTDETIARFNGTGGDTIDDTGITITDANVMTFPDTELIRPVLRDYGMTVNTVGASGAAETLDMEVANVHDITLDDNCTFTFSNPPASGTLGKFTLILRQDGGGTNTTTWPASVDWEGGIAPTLTVTGSAVDVLTFVTVDAGTTWLGFTAGLDMK